MIDANPKKRPDARFVLQKLKSMKPRIFFYQIGKKNLEEDILFSIASFLTPQEFSKTIMSVNKTFRLLNSFKKIWIYYLNKYSFFPKDSIPKDFMLKDHFDFFKLKPWTFRSLKGFKLSKSRNSIENITKPASPMDIKVCCTEQSLNSGKSLIRILFDERIPKCFIGVVSSKNLEIALKEIDKETMRYVKYFRDGSTSLHKEKGEYRNIEMTDEKCGKIYQYKVREGDILSVFLDMDNHSVQFYVNNDFSTSTIIHNVREMKLNQPVHLTLGMPLNQKFTILKNLKSENDPILKRVSWTTRDFYFQKKIEEELTPSLEESEDWLEILIFPNEIWQEIFTFLEPTELLIVNLVSKKFKKLEEKTWKYMVPTIPSFSLFDEKNYYFKILKSPKFKTEYESSLSKLVYEKPFNLQICKTLTFPELFREIFIQKDTKALKTLLYMIDLFIDWNILFLWLNDLFQNEKEEIKKNVEFSIHYFLKTVSISFHLFFKGIGV
jgi:hypothetical protein